MREKQKGAVSLFAVVFAMLIITVITLSFLRLMVADQNQSTNANLAEGARQSALAGVEDAKRAILKYKSDCVNSTNSACNELRQTLTSSQCNAALEGLTGVPVGGREVIIKQDSSGDTTSGDLEQAYTCVKLALNTEDYLGHARAGQTLFIPLAGVDDFDKIDIEWFGQKDIDATQTALDIEPQPSGRQLPRTGWPKNRPSVLEAQFVQVGSTFNLADFDQSSDTSSNTNTFFMYPVARSGVFEQTEISVADDLRGAPREASSAPKGVGCQTSVTDDGYACWSRISLPNVVGESDNGERKVYLRVRAHYNDTHFRIVLRGVGTGAPVLLDGVQAEVDSTGRANNIFKRISSRVDMFGDSGLYPDAAVRVKTNFCKNFGVTDTEVSVSVGVTDTEVSVSGGCTP